MYTIVYRRTASDRQPPAEAPPRLTESSSSAPPLHGVAAAAWHKAAAAHPLAIRGIGDIKGMPAMRCGLRCVAAPPPSAGSAPRCLPRRLYRRCGAPCSGRRLSGRGGPVGGARSFPPVGRLLRPLRLAPPRPRLGSTRRSTVALPLPPLCSGRGCRPPPASVPLAASPPSLCSPPPPPRGGGRCRRHCRLFWSLRAPPPRLVSVGALLHRSERCRQGRCRVCQHNVCRHTLDSITSRCSR